VFAYENMSEVQSKTIPVALNGTDVFGKAKTGSGKTLGFLIPALQRLHLHKTQPGRIGVLVLAPTRELAEQTRKEAEKLLTFMTGRGVQCVIGGTNIKQEKNRLRTQPCDVLVATPGRLLDHLSEQEFASRMAGVSVVVLDEADRLLDMGFQPDIKKILTFLPPKDRRQTLLFTATVPEGVRAIGTAFLRPDHTFIDVVLEDDQASPALISHHHLVVPRNNVFSALANLVNLRQATDKIIVFFSTARMAQYAAALFRQAGLAQTLEIHSRMSQPGRTRSIAAFSHCTTGLLCASDAIARGIDVPDVTLIIQVGHTDAVQYEHRVGRTGRAGKEGQGIWLIAGDESSLVLPPVKAKIPIQPLAQDIASLLSAPLSLRFAQALKDVMNNRELKDLAGKAFAANLGFYASHMRALRWDKAEVASKDIGQLASMGLTEVPPIEAKILGKMGMRGTPGLIEVSSKPQNRNGRPQGKRRGSDSD